MNKKTILSGSLWTSVSTITTALVQILRLSILAHFLDKSDFGIVAILSMVLGFTNMFSELGFSTIVMHKQNITDREFSSLYWAQLLLYIAIYVIISSISPFVAKFFDEPSITYLLPIAMLDLIFYGVGRLYDTIIQKELKFNVLAKRNIIASCISLVVAVVLAYKGAGVYSLILSTLTQTIILNVWNLLQGFRSMALKPYLSFRLIKPLFNMGINQTFTHIFDYISTKIDVLIIGKMLGSEVLGMYNLAKELVLKGSMLVNSIVNRVSLPLFAKKQDDTDSLRRNYQKLIRMISFVNFPICTIIGALGFIIIPVLYGEKYMEVIPILYTLSVWATVNCIGNPVGNIIIATGRTDLSLKYTIIRFICYIPAMYVLSMFNIHVLTWGTVILSAVFVIISWFMQLNKTINIDFRSFVGSFLSPLIYTLLLGAIGYLLMDTVALEHSHQMLVLGVALLWCIVYLVVYVYIQRFTIMEIKNMIFR